MHRSKVDNEGRILIPANYRKLIGLKKGGYVLTEIKDGQLITRVEQNQCTICETQIVTKEKYIKVNGKKVCEECCLTMLDKRPETQK